MLSRAFELLGFLTVISGQTYTLGSVATVAVDKSAGYFSVLRKLDGATVFTAAANQFVTTGEGKIDHNKIITDGALFDKKFLDTTVVNGLTTISDVTQTTDSVVHITGEIQQSDGSNGIPYAFSMHSSNSSSIAWSVAVSNSTPVAVISIGVDSDPEEEIYGMGLQYSRWNLKGLRFPIISSEQGIGRGLEPVTAAINKFGKGNGGTWYTTYSACSSYITNSSTGLLVNTTNIGIADFSPSSTTLSYYGTSQLSGHILLSNDTGSSSTRLRSLMTAMTELTGRMRPLPDWVLNGAIVGLEGGQEFVSGTVAQLRKWGVPLAGVWLQDWSGQASFAGGQKRVVWNWQLDKAWYNNWTATVSDWRDQGTRVLTYINPFYTNISGVPGTFRNNYFEEGVEKGYFVKNSTNQT
jgi:alpha-glucosidase (family GH31 glycosyl hydrolase)